jgi:hypothetical protein
MPEWLRFGELLQKARAEVQTAAGHPQQLCLLQEARQNRLLQILWWPKPEERIRITINVTIIVTKPIPDVNADIEPVRHAL